MGQYFMFANLDAHQSTGYLGKLGEFFYDAIDFLYLIAVPACPLERTGWSNSKALDNHPVYPGSWAGDRIICLGDYAETWPEGKLDDSNLSEETPGEFTESATEIRTRDFSYDWKLKEAYPSDRVWVLRNLTKKVYVRSNGVPTINEDDSELTYDEHKGFAGKPGLSHILFSRISWSDDFSISMAYDKDEDIARGAWAADRLDVRLLDEVEQELITDGWIDITQVEARRLHDIFVQDHYFECDFPEEPGMASSNDVLVAPASKDHTDE
ncbi:hypothetical protein CVT26_015509 [Gymnopilus dilepis]|uniref:Uncharacterized protein n=1 Tax=Gymnopilus dilepis TaxID=231916 RepID=A0A409WA32_9AGAR|nr:hypothetical protein CVT26_015509 [Gymnopilus dilepis]